MELTGVCRCKLYCGRVLSAYFIINVCSNKIRTEPCNLSGCGTPLFPNPGIGIRLLSSNIFATSPPLPAREGCRKRVVFYQVKRTQHTRALAQVSALIARICGRHPRDLELRPYRCGLRALRHFHRKFPNTFLIRSGGDTPYRTALSDCRRHSDMYSVIKNQHAPPLCFAIPTPTLPDHHTHTCTHNLTFNSTADDCTALIVATTQPTGPITGEHRY